MNNLAIRRKYFRLFLFKKWLEYLIPKDLFDYGHISLVRIVCKMLGHIL